MGLNPTNQADSHKVTKQGSPRHHSKLFRAIEEHTPGPKWASLFQVMWSEYKNWFLIQGDAARPGYGESLKQLKLHMPELVPTYRTLTDLAGGSDSAARLLSLYCPPPYLSGCTQAVWTGEQPVLVRNYDYNPSRLEGVLLKTRWNDQTVIAMSAKRLLPSQSWWNWIASAIWSGSFHSTASIAPAAM